MSPHMETCLVDCVFRPWSPQLECQSVPVEQSTTQTQPRESKAQAPGQEIALENTSLYGRELIVFLQEMGEGRQKREKKNNKCTRLALLKEWLCMIAGIKGGVSSSPIRLDLGNKSK